STGSAQRNLAPLWPHSKPHGGCGPGVQMAKAPSNTAFAWGERRDLNPRHPGPQPGALPTELRPPSLPGHTAGPQQDARCPEGHRAAEDEYSGPRPPARHVPAAPAEPAEEYRAAISRAVAESGPGCGTNSASRTTSGIDSRASAGGLMIRSMPSSSRLSSASVTTQAISMRASRSMSSPVISQSIQTSRSFILTRVGPRLPYVASRNPFLTKRTEARARATTIRLPYHAVI